MFNFGDLVIHRINDQRAHMTGKSYVIGFAPKPKDRSVVVLADARTIGMPINVQHLTLISSGHLTKAEKLRNRFEQQFPGSLARLTIVDRLVKP